jgi:hypothetical protein
VCRLAPASIRWVAKEWRKGVDGGSGHPDLFACHHHQALKRANGHRREGIPNAQGQPLGITGTPACIGSRATGRWARQAARSAGAQPRPSGSEEAKQEQRVTMNLPVAAQVFKHLRGQRNHPVFCPVDVSAAQRIHPCGLAFGRVCLTASQAVRLPPRTSSLPSLPRMSWMVRPRH